MRPATASGHLDPLLEAGFVVCEARARHRHLRLVDAEGAQALVAERDAHTRAQAPP